MHVIRVAHSPDSDDAFMYYGLACGAVKPDGIRFEQALSDIESANAAAQEGRFDLTAISAAAYPSLAGRYLLLDSGASFGDGYGPCVVVPAGSAVRRLEDLAGKRIATPGRRTSAALALALRLPDHVAVPMDFKAVGPAALRGDVEAGLVIHEGQLTAAAEGLRVVEDLGRRWCGRPAWRCAGRRGPRGASPATRPGPPPPVRSRRRTRRRSRGAGSGPRGAGRPPPRWR